MPGDWSCPACGDHQFARNLRCRQCGEARPKAAPLTALPPAAAAMGRRTRSRTQDRERSASRSRRRRRRKVKRLKPSRRKKRSCSKRLRRKRHHHRKKGDESGHGRQKAKRHRRTLGAALSTRGQERGAASRTTSSSSNAPGVPTRGEAVNAAQRGLADAERAVNAMRTEVAEIEARLAATPVSVVQREITADADLNDQIAMARQEATAAFDNAVHDLERELREEMDRKIDEAKSVFLQRYQDGRRRLQEDSDAVLAERERSLKEEARVNAQKAVNGVRGALLRERGESRAHAEAVRRLGEEERRLLAARQRLASLSGAKKSHARPQRPRESKHFSGSECSNGDHAKSSDSYSDYSGDGP